MKRQTKDLTLIPEMLSEIPPGWIRTEDHKIILEFFKRCNALQNWSKPMLHRLALFFPGYHVLLQSLFLMEEFNKEEWKEIINQWRTRK